MIAVISLTILYHQKYTFVKALNEFIKS